MKIRLFGGTSLGSKDIFEDNPPQGLSEARRGVPSGAAAVIILIDLSLFTGSAAGTWHDTEYCGRAVS